MTNMLGSKPVTLQNCALLLSTLFKWGEGGGSVLLSVFLCAGCARRPVPAWQAETEGLLEHELHCFSLKASIGILLPLTRLNPREMRAGEAAPRGPSQETVPQHARRLLALTPDDFGRSVRLLMATNDTEARMAGLVLNRLYGGALTQNELLRVIEDDDSCEVKVACLFSTDVRRMIQHPVDAYQRLALLCLEDRINGATRDLVLSKLRSLSEVPNVREYVVQRLRSAKRPVEKEVFVTSLPLPLREPERRIVVALSRDESALVRCAVVGHMALDVQEGAAQSHLDVFRNAVKDGEPKVRVWAAIGLGACLRASSSVKARESLVAALDDASAKVRTFAAQSLEGQDEAVKPLVAALDDSDTTVRNSVLRSLARTVNISTTADLGYLEGARLDSETERLRAHAQTLLDRKP